MPGLKAETMLEFWSVLGGGAIREPISCFKIDAGHCTSGGRIIHNRRIHFLCKMRANVKMSRRDNARSLLLRGSNVGMICWREDDEGGRRFDTRRNTTF